jgi:hypothetical protein
MWKASPFSAKIAILINGRSLPQLTLIAAKKLAE